MEVIGIGDCHFDKLDNIIVDATELICASITKVLNYALDNGVTHVLFYGDICERPRMSYHSQVMFMKTLMKTRFKDLEFHIILGNHDFAEDGTHSLQVLETVANMMDRNLHVYTKQTVVELEGIKFNFMPYPHTKTLKNHINVGHFEVAGSLRDNGRQIDEGPDSKHVTLMGHLHTKHRVRNTYYSGTLYQTNFGEVEKKFFHHVRIDDATPKGVEVTNVKFTPPWRLVNLTVDHPDVLDQIEDNPRTLYKLFIHEGVDIDLNAVLVKHANVVKHNTFKSKKELEVLVSQAWELDSDTIADVVNEDEQQLVKTFLKSKGFKRSQVDQALTLLQRIKGNTNKATA